jgi:hypothetical protein
MVGGFLQATKIIQQVSKFAVDNGIKRQWRLRGAEILLGLFLRAFKGYIFIPNALFGSPIVPDLP